jgi:tryptophanyl-tRNA synthetase
VGALDRATSYKDKLAKGITANVGLYSYPILMASDILLFGGEIVPVGNDQKQHIEITRDIAIRFNQTYEDVFIVPEPDIEKTNQLVPGIDGQKMSKSYGNTIPIFGDEKSIRKKFMSIVTDSTDIEKPKSIDTALYELYALFLNDNEKKELANRFKTPGMRYGDIKQELYDCFWAQFSPYREKRAYLEKHKDYVIEKLNNGSQKASVIADSFLKKARIAMGLNYGDNNV